MQTALSELRGAFLVAITDKGHAQRLSIKFRKKRAGRNAVADYRQRLVSLDANYDATEDDFNKLFADFNN